MPGENQSIAQGGVQKMAGYWDNKLLKAAENGDLIKVQTALEKGGNPNAKDKYGLTPLHHAVFRGHVEIVKILLERGADPNAKNYAGWTPLHDAALRGHVEIVKLLLEHGANPNTKDCYGITPLHIAAQEGHVEIVKLLLERGADPRIADNEGHIPLDYAEDSAIRSLLESALRNSYSGVPREPRTQGNEATRVDNGDIERKSNENE
jgi:cytohesin